jgi:RNA12 protein
VTSPVYALISPALCPGINPVPLQLIHKIRAGQKPVDAVDDIIRQGVTELRKRAFGEDADDVRSLSWSREQAWAVFRALASRDTVPYHETLMNVPFKGDEGPLRSMERAELIFVDALNGRPSTIRPGRPVYRYIFRRLANGLFTSLFPAAQANISPTFAI